MNESSNFRRASDTRALPQIPTASATTASSQIPTASATTASSEIPTASKKRADWMRVATPVKTAFDRFLDEYNITNRNKVPCKEPTGNPKMQPLGSPLTIAQATQLVNNSFPGEYSKLIAPYKNVLITLVVDESKNALASERRDFRTLEILSKNICNQEALPGTINMLERNLKDAAAAGVSKRDFDTIVPGILGGVARQIALGFDIIDKKHFCFDDNGNITGITESNVTRKQKCIAFINQQQTTGAKSVYQDPSSFKEFIQKQADPFKGSPQGSMNGSKSQTTVAKSTKASIDEESNPFAYFDKTYGSSKRTRKHKKHIKKTLRRRKVRRNVH